MKVRCISSNSSNIQTKKPMRMLIMKYQILKDIHQTQVKIKILSEGVFQNILYQVDQLKANIKIIQFQKTNLHNLINYNNTNNQEQKELAWRE